MYVTHDVTGTLRAEMGGHPPLVFDARGNGGGICPTITGDHQNRITDYTAIALSATRRQVSGSMQNGTERSVQAEEI